MALAVRLSSMDQDGSPTNERQEKWMAGWEVKKERVNGTEDLNML